MDARLIERVETGIEAVAAAMFGGAVAYAVGAWLDSPESLRWWACSAAAGILAFLTCLRAMRAVTARKPSLTVPVFNVRDIECDMDELVLSEDDRIERQELVLTDADRLRAPVEDALVLDDILAEVGSNSRVVRLFDHGTMPAAAQPKPQIRESVAPGAPPASLSDASQALSEALAQLRRSLR